MQIKLSEIKQTNCYVQCDSHERAIRFIEQSGLYLDGKLDEKATIVAVFEDGTCMLVDEIIMKMKTVYHIDNIDLNN